MRSLLLGGQKPGGVTFTLMEMMLNPGTRLSTSMETSAGGHHMKVFMCQGQDTTSHVRAPHSFQCPPLEGAPPAGFN